MLIKLKEDQKLTAALHEHRNQVELLKFQTTLDLRIFAGYITLQLALGSWISAYPLRNLHSIVGLGLIDLALALLAGLILWKSYVRRKQVAKVVRRLNEALGFTEPDVYLEKLPLHEENRFMPWLPFYIAGIVIGLLGIGILLFQPIHPISTKG